MKITDRFTYEEVKGFKFGNSLFGVPKLFSHIYFVDGLLIDTGHRRMANEVFREVENLPVQQIFITHYHEDHSGNIAQLQQRFRCPVYASEKCCELMKAPPAISFPQKLSWGNRPAFKTLRPKSNFINTENYNFQLIPIPGHAIDMVALYEPNRKWLFSSDLYVSPYIAYFLEEESMLEQINSIRRILKLDFQILLCGHNPQFKNGKEKLKRKLDFFEDFFEKVANDFEKGYAPKQILKNLNIKEYWGMRILSNGKLSRLNMVKSVIRDLDREKKKIKSP